ncbi:MAG TPA: prolyl oligopeptidase family serine peptidase, partial [Vicinamibacteria bacterium]|nr:prolyl oligopeptidase family serine peptidase [Vicinamibacteria bacterium]
LAEQSKLTPADRDPAFRLTLEHLATDDRALGLSPRDVTWAPGGEAVYFRWREDPASGQLPASDPWYAVDASGTSLRVVDVEEARTIPTANVSWSTSRDLAAWTREGTLFVWTKPTGTKAVFTFAESLGHVHVRSDGNRVFFATRGYEVRGDDSGDLWAYDRATSHVRQIALVVTKDEEKKSQKTWLEEQQLELIDVVRKRKEWREREEALDREREPYRPQEIPIEKGARAFQLRLSPDGKFVTFLWEKKSSEENRTSYMEFVGESGYATEKKARPKVGEALSEYRMGFVRVDPLKERDAIEIGWIDDGIEKATILHGPYWNPQGTKAALQILSMDHKDRWLSLVDLDTGVVTHLDHQTEEAWIGGPLVEGRWQPGFLEWLPDGTAFGLGSVESGWAMLTLAHVDGRADPIVPLTRGEWEVRRAELSPDGTTWLLTASREHPGEEQLYHLPARGGELVRITEHEGKVRTSVSPEGKRMALLFESPELLADLYLTDNRQKSAWTRITKSGTDDFYRTAWIGSEIVRFDDPAGNDAWAKIWERPSNAHGGAIVYAHGCGECAQGVDKGWTRLGAILYANYMYQKGYVAASVDYRGSSGYGHANRTYAFRQMGISDIDSALPLLDILARRRGVDSRRIGLYGGSYGGFFTLMSLFRHPGKYRAGVALYPVTDWAHYNQGYTNRILNGSQLDDPEAYRRSSPMYYADGLEDALQIQHGLVDDNVQIQDSFRLAQILMEKKKDFDLVVYPVEDHGWDEVATRRDSYKRMTEWFDRHLLVDGKPTDSESQGASP